MGRCWVSYLHLPSMLALGLALAGIKLREDGLSY